LIRTPHQRKNRVSTQGMELEKDFTQEIIHLAGIQAVRGIGLNIEKRCRSVLLCGEWWVSSFLCLVWYCGGFFVDRHRWFAGGNFVAAFVLG